MLFGHQDETTQTGTVSSVQPTNDTSTSTATASDTQDSTSLVSPTTANASSSAPELSASTTNSRDDSPAAPTNTGDTVLSTAPTEADSTLPSSDLIELKQEALDELTPLVDHLEQSPQEKFRTTMMMIQSTDNKALIKDAFAAAKEITDDKTRAQALLDVINEINYFTQKESTNQ